MPREKMTSEALAIWDRALADLRAAGAVVEPFHPPVTLTDYRAHSPTPNTRVVTSPETRDRRRRPPTRCIATSPAARIEPLEAVRRGYAAYRAFYDVLPERFEECVPLLGSRWSTTRRGSRSPARAPRWWRRSDDRCAPAGVSAMVYPTMPFNAFRLADGWPDIRTPLGYGNWLGLPEVSVPAGLGADGMPALNLSVTGLPGEDARVLALAHAYERQSRRFVPPRRQ